MAIYKNGSVGVDVARIQKALKDAGFYQDKGMVHGITYDLAGQFGLDLRKAD